MRSHNRVRYIKKSANGNDPKEQLTTHPIISYLKWQLFILKAIGLSPFYTTRNFYEIGAPTRRWLLISRGIIFVRANLTLLHIYSLLSPAILQMLFRRSKTDGITNLFDVAICMLSDITVSFSCAFNTNILIQIINGFLKVDQALEEYREYRNLRAQRSCIKNPYNRYLLLTSGYISFIVIAYAWRTMSYFTFYFFVCISYYQVENAASCAFVVFISTLLHLLAVRFQYVNQLLSQYNSNTVLQKRRNSQVEYLGGNAIMASEVKLRLFAENSQLIYRLHNDLLDLYKMINNYAGLGVLVVLLFACCGMLSCTYACSVYNWNGDSELYTVLWTSSWIPIFAGMVILLAMSCDNATKEANKTTQVLARVYGKGKDYQNIIDKFLTKSIKQEVHFTAYGFFVIDNTTMFKIFSAVTTYLVILIQFKQLEESKAKDGNR